MTDREALQNLVFAWDALPGGKNYSPKEIQTWLKEDMAPAITAAREILSRERIIHSILKEAHCKDLEQLYNWVMKRHE